MQEEVKRGRGGRPRAGSEGDVTARLLAAATRLFLEKGYDATSCDQVAIDARAGKASIYARYVNKGALFAAVIDHMLARSFAEDQVAAEGPLHERLAQVAMRVLADALNPDALALLRLLVAELPRFADSGMRADQLFWQAGVRRVANVMAPGAPANFDSALAPAAQLIELVLAPPLMRALLGEPVEPLLAAAPRRIDAAIAMLAASGTLAGWD
jgi:AcrR family transcriptional regulator